MYEIVMAIDTDEDRAIAQAETVAALPGADDAVHATLLHDFTYNPEGGSVSQVAAVRRAREVLEDAGVAVTLEESSGDPGHAIVELAEEVDADLICVAGRKRSPAGKALFGSVTQDVFLGTDRPVLLVSADGN
ncbi:MAG: universal stress protein [Halobacteriales archaeon]|nr:universal stress protein [Halobacteriales archaeon]